VQDCRTSRLNHLQSIEFTRSISSRPLGSSTDGAEENLELSSSISLMLLSNGFSSEEEDQGLLHGERSGKVITHCTTGISLALWVCDVPELAPRSRGHPSFFCSAESPANMDIDLDLAFPTPLNASSFNSKEFLVADFSISRVESPNVDWFTLSLKFFPMVFKLGLGSIIRPPATRGNNLHSISLFH